MHIKPHQLLSSPGVWNPLSPSHTQGSVSLQHVVLAEATDRPEHSSEIWTAAMNHSSPADRLPPRRACASVGRVRGIHRFFVVHCLLADTFRRLWLTWTFIAFTCWDIAAIFHPHNNVSVLAWMTHRLLQYCGMSECLHRQHFRDPLSSVVL